MYNPRLHFHFVGIGGSGMSGIAEVLLQEGFHVSGSDARGSATLDRLKSRGAVVSVGHARENVPADASVVVYSSAVQMDNPELMEAHQRGIPVVRRAEVLAELMRLKFGVGVAGSHGKTTTTTFTAAILEQAGLDPTVVIGGKVEALAAGGKRGRGQYLVAETDESDRSFLLLKPTIAVVTNIDAEHMGAYGSMGNLLEAFQQFVDSVPFYGLVVLCADCPRALGLAAKSARRTVTYGFTPGAQVSATDIVSGPEGVSGEVFIHGEHRGRLHVRFPARHLFLNSLAAVAVGIELGVDFKVIQEALTGVGGVERRLEVIGREGGITVINDYAHHPTEIRATLGAVRENMVPAGGRLLALFQPHRYSRTQECFAQFLDAFSAADEVVVSDIYAAGEEPREGVTSEILTRALVHPSARFGGPLDECERSIADRARSGDVVVCLGAGSVGGSPQRLLQGWAVRG